MEALLQQWDGEEVIIRYDRPTGSWIVIAIHSTRLGPAGGGTRMKTYPDLPAAIQDALRLSEGMTQKNAISGLANGGGKAVIAIPPDLASDARLDLLRRYGSLVHQLGGLFRTGPDVGTSSADMDIVAETGSPYVSARTREGGGVGDSSPPTAQGVFQGIRIVAERLAGPTGLSGMTVLVQGAGSVGRRLLTMLHAAEADVLFSDVNENAIRQVREELPLTFVPPEAVYDTSCDIFAPCALGGVLNEDTISRLQCRAVAGAANNQLGTPEDAERLHARNILYAPDFVINMGGVLAIVGMEDMGWTEAEANEHVINAVGRSLRQVFAISDAEGISTTKAARQIVEERLQAAKS